MKRQPWGGGSRLRIRGRLLVAFLGLALGLSAALTILMERSARRSLEADLASHLEAVAAAATTQIDPSLVAAALAIGSEGGERTRARRGGRLRQLQEATGVRRIYVIDPSGRVQLDTDSSAVLGADLPQARVHKALLEATAGGRTASSPLFRDAAGQIRKTGYAPLAISGEVSGFVGVEADARFLGEIGALRRRMAMAGLIGFAAATLLSIGLARGLTHPLGQLVDAARSLGAGQLERRIPIGRPDEIGFLARTLEEARVRLAERDRSLRAMVAGIAHEVRNPLGGIQIYAELLLNDPTLTDAQRGRVRKVLGEIHRLGEIVEQFLAYARPQTPERASIDPAGVARETIELLSGLLQERRVEAILRPPAQPLRIQADPGQLRQILLNLVRNAAEASPPDGKVLVSWEANGPTVALHVEDEGPGIPLDRREQVFEPFFTTKPDGAGLGLAIVRHLAEHNGGRVGLERGQGGGCRFIVRFEAAEAEEEPVA